MSNENNSLVWHVVQIQLIILSNYTEINQDFLCRIFVNKC